MPIGDKRKEAAMRGGGLVVHYLVRIIVGLPLTVLNALRALVDIGWQFVTNGEGPSDDGYIPKSQRRLDGFRNWSYYGSDDSSWRR